MSKRIKILLYGSLLFNLAVLLYFGPRLYQRIFNSEASYSTDYEYSMNRNKYFEQLPSDSNAIVFLGTSITQNFEIHESFKNTHLQNRGINGDVIKGMRNRLPAILNQHPKVIFIEAGINDLGGNKASVEEVISDYNDLLDEIQKRPYKPQLNILSILPVSNQNKGMNGYFGRDINEKIRIINDQLKAICNDRNITFIDLYEHFQKKGEIKSELTIDGVHLSGEGYALLTERLVPHVENNRPH